MKHVVASALVCASIASITLNAAKRGDLFGQTLHTIIRNIPDTVVLACQMQNLPSPKDLAKAYVGDAETNVNYVDPATNHTPLESSVLALAVILTCPQPSGSLIPLENFVNAYDGVIALLLGRQDINIRGSQEEPFDIALTTYLETQYTDYHATIQNIMELIAKRAAEQQINQTWWQARAEKAMEQKAAPAIKVLMKYGKVHLALAANL